MTLSGEEGLLTIMFLLIHVAFPLKKSSCFSLWEDVIKLLTQGCVPRKDSMANRTLWLDVPMSSEIIAPIMMLNNNKKFMIFLPGMESIAFHG